MFRQNFTGLPILPLFPGSPGMPWKSKQGERSGMENRAEWGKEEFEEDRKRGEREKKDIKTFYDNRVQSDQDGRRG